MLSNILLLSIVDIVFGEPCTDSDALHINWETLNTGESNIPDYDYSIEFNQYNLEILIDVNLTYLGYSTDPDKNKLGTTYVLDFESKNAHILPLDKSGTCSNRNAFSYKNEPFTKWFDYSVISRTVGDPNFLAYPPPGPEWYIESIGCKKIHYEGRFTYKQLFDECGNYDGTNKYSSLTTDNNWINLTLTFYINIVSPLVATHNTGIYRIYQLLSAPFVIAIKKTIMVLQPVGIRLFSISVVAVYKENKQNNFRLIVVTESAEYLKLSDPALVTYPYDLENNHQIIFHVKSPTDYVDNPCIASKHYFCTQFWEISADDVPCPPTVFTGIYGLQFEAICNNASNDSENTERLANCDKWKSKFDHMIDLSTNLVWVDEVCDPEIWNITLDATSTYYTDSTYEHACSPDPGPDNCLFRVGKDRVYVQYELNEPAGVYAVFSVWIINIWLCTTAPEVGKPALNVPGSSNLGGCLSDVIDDDGPDWILQNMNEVMLYNVTVGYNESSPNIARVSFIPPVSIFRDTLYVHAQIKLALVEDDHFHHNHNHRRMLNDNEINQKDHIKHVFGSVQVDASEAQPYQNIKDIEEYKRDSGFYDAPENNEPIGNEKKNVIQELDKEHDNNDNLHPEMQPNVHGNNHINGLYVSMDANAMSALEIVGLVVCGLLLANMCFLMYSAYDKHLI